MGLRSKMMTTPLALVNHSNLHDIFCNTIRRRNDRDKRISDIWNCFCSGTRDQSSIINRKWLQDIFFLCCVVKRCWNFQERILILCCLKSNWYLIRSIGIPHFISQLQFWFGWSLPAFQISIFCYPTSDLFWV